MSRASKHVEWCLKKSKEDLEICKRERIKPKHRGLLKTSPNNEEAKKHVAKAEHDLKVTRYLIKGGFTDTSLGTIFYTMYQCFLAIAAKFGYDSGNQTCTIALIEHLKEEGNINLDSKFIDYFKYEKADTKNSIIVMREDYTYGTQIKAEKSKIDLFIKDCEELISVTRNIVYQYE